jgi:hypothetical protein
VKVAPWSECFGKSWISLMDFEAGAAQDFRRMCRAYFCACSRARVCECVSTY